MKRLLFSMFLAILCIEEPACARSFFSTPALARLCNSDLPEEQAQCSGVVSAMSKLVTEQGFNGFKACFP